MFKNYRETINTYSKKALAKIILLYLCNNTKARGLSLVQVEMQIGITIARLSQLERGFLKGLFGYELMLIAKALCVNAALLMGDIGTGECDEPTIKELAHRKQVLDFDRERYKKMMGK